MAAAAPRATSTRPLSPNNANRLAQATATRAKTRMINRLAAILAGVSMAVTLGIVTAHAGTAVLDGYTGAESRS